MNQRQARAYVLRCLAAESRAHRDNGSAWLSQPLKIDSIAVDENGEFNEADQQRVLRALDDIADELERRSEKLSVPSRPIL